MRNIQTTASYIRLPITAQMYTQKKNTKRMFHERVRNYSMRLVQMYNLLGTVRGVPDTLTLMTHKWNVYTHTHQ